ncbi:MAG: PTS transporter subunit EIIA [Lachnospiraceae bacterium]|nr:PTS transporter subunit EIIA [Lachnospiraceae bacterium]
MVRIMLNELTGKQRQLLRYLMKPGGFLTAEELAKRLGISVRTVIRYVNAINDELREERARICLKRGQGYFLEGDLGRLEFLASEKSPPEDSAGRVNQIILTLLYQESITIERLSDLLYLSVSVLNKATAAVREVLGHYGLSLGSKPYYGLFIEGSEKDKRTLLADIGFEYRHARMQNIGIPNVSEAEFAAIDRTAFSYLERNGLMVSDPDLNYLLVRMTIVVSRCRSGYAIQGMPAPDASALHNYRMVRGIMEELGAQFGIAFPEEEIRYALIYSGFVGYDFELAEMKVDEEIHEFVLGFMREMSEFTGTVYGQDENAARALSIHLKMLMQRAHLSQSFPNPVIEMIKSDYPVEMNYAIFLARRFEERFGVRIDEDEIGYLTVHLGVCHPPDRDRKKAVVLCSYGAGTSQLLRERMQSELAGINIVGVYPVHYLSIAVHKEVDFIISAVPVKTEAGAPPVIVEENLLGPHTYDRLKEKIWKRINICGELIGFLDGNCFARLKTGDRFQIIKELSGLLRRTHGLDDTVLDTVVRRELASATDIGNLVAVPHMLQKGEFRSGIAVGILDKPVLWEKEMVQLVFLACFNQADSRSASAFRTLYKLVKSKETVERMIKAADFEAFVEALRTGGDGGMV